MPEMVAHKMERVEPSLVVIVWRAWGERSWTRSGLSCRLFLVSEKISARKVRGEDGQTERDGDGGSCRQRVLAREMAAAKA